MNDEINDNIARELTLPQLDVNTKDKFDGLEGKL